MLRILAVSLFIMTLVSLKPAGSTAAAPPRLLTVGCEDKEDPPRLLGEGPRIHPDRPGTAIEILRLIARQHRLSLDIRRYPWKRTLHMLANNEIDLLVYASFTPERAAIGEYPMLGGVPDPSRRFATLRYMTYRRKGEPVYALPGTISGTPGPVGVPGGDRKSVV